MNNHHQELDKATARLERELADKLEREVSRGYVMLSPVPPPARDRTMMDAITTEGGQIPKTTDGNESFQRHGMPGGPQFRDDKLEHLFSYHAQRPSELAQYREIRYAGLIFARVVAAMCPDGADKAAAIRLIREAVMTANAAIALEGVA